MELPADFIELVELVGEYALLVVGAVVLVMVLISAVDRHPRPKSDPRKDDDAESGKP